MLAKALARTWKPILTILLAVFFAAPGGGAPPEVTLVDAWGNPVTEIGVNSRLYVQVKDDDAASYYSGGFGSVAATVSSPTGDVETVSCFKQASGLFLGELPLSIVGVGFPENGELQILVSQVASVSYDSFLGSFNDTAQVTVRGADLAMIDAEGAPLAAVVDGDLLRVRLEGPEGTNPLAADSLTVVATRSGTADSESFTLLETGPDTDIFLGSLPLARSGQSGSGVLDWSAAPATITVTYTGPSLTVAATVDVVGARVEVIDSHGVATDRLGPQDGVRLRVFDPYNDNPASLLEYRTVTVSESPGGDTENMNVWEVAPGVFESRTTFPFGAGSSGNGLLAVVPGSSQLLATFTPSVGTAVTADASVLNATLRFLSQNGEEVADYLVGEWVEVELRYPGAGSPMQVTLSTVITGDFETLYLNETAASSGVFRGRMLTRFSSSPSSYLELDVYQYQLGPYAGWQLDTITARFDLGGGSFITRSAPIRGGAEVELLDTLGEPTDAFGAGEKMRVRLRDFDNAMAGPSLETRYINLQCLGSADNETVTLTETGGNTSTFEALVPLSVGSAVAFNDRLECQSGYEVVAFYNGGMIAVQAEDRAWVYDVAIDFVDDEGTPIREILKGVVARVRVRSEAANADSHDFDTVNVTVASRNTFDSAVLELRETTLDSGIFEGEVRIVGVGAGAYEDVEVGIGPPPLELADVLVASLPGVEAEAAVLEGRLRVTDLAGNELSYLLTNGSVRVELEMPAIGYPGLQTTDVQVLTSYYESQPLTLWETSPSSSLFQRILQLDPSISYPYNSFDSTISPYVGSTVEFSHTATGVRIALPVTSVEVHFEDAAGARLESAPYGVPLWVEVVKATNLLNPAQIETLSVRVSTDRLGDDELVTLTETTVSSGIFRASLPVNASTGRSSGNGAIEADAGAVDTLRARVVGVEGVEASIPTRQAQVRFLNAQGQETDILVLGQVATIEIVDTLRASNYYTTVHLKSGSSSLFYGYALPTYPGSPTFRISFLPYYEAVQAPATSLQTVPLAPGQVVSVTIDYLYSYGASTVATATAEDRRLELLGEDGEELLELLEGESLKIRLIASSQQSGVLESRTVTVGAQLGGDIETLELWETSASSGVFERVLATRFFQSFGSQNQPNNGVLGLSTENPSVPVTGETIVVRHGAIDETPIEKTVPAVVAGRLMVLDGDTPAVAVLPDYASRTLRLVRPTLPNGSVVTFEVQSGYYSTDFETFTATSLGNGVFEAQVPCYPIGHYGPYSGNGYVEMTPGSQIFFRYQLTGYHSGQLEVVLPVATASMSFVDAATGVVLTEAPDARPFKLRIQDEQNLTSGIDYRSVTLTTQLGDSETFSVPEIDNWQGIFELVVTPRVSDSAIPGNAQLEVDRNSSFVAAPIYDRVTATLASPAIVASLPLKGPEITFTNAAGDAVESIATGGLAYLKVDDNSANVNAGQVETIQVELFRPLESSEGVTLTETGPATGIFTGSIPVLPGTYISNNGQIEANSGDVVVLRYSDVNYFTLEVEAPVRASRLAFIAAPGGDPVERYLEGENVVVRMEYAAGNTSPTVAEQVNVELRSIYWGNDVETLTLTETAPSSGVFEGGMATSLNPQSSGDGTLQVGRGSSLDAARVSFGDDSATADFDAARLRLLNFLLQPIAQLVPGQPLVVEVTKFAGTDPGLVDTLVGLTELAAQGIYSITDQEGVTLVETGADTHVFRATVTTVAGGEDYPWDGILSFWYQDQVVATLTDGPFSLIASVNAYYDQAPVTNYDFIYLSSGASGNLDVDQNDEDPDGGALTVVAVRPAPTSVGVSGVVEPNGTVTITAAPDAVGYQELIYTVGNPAGLFAEGQIRVFVQAPPTVSIISPTEGSVFGSQGPEINFEAAVVDPDQPDICEFSPNPWSPPPVVWTSNIQGILSAGCQLSGPPEFFQLGTHIITVTVTDSNNHVATDTVTITIDGPPVLTITNPDENTWLLQGGQITLTATAVDGLDGDLGSTITWSSNIQGPLGTGSPLPVNLSLGTIYPATHEITATVVDSLGNVASVTRTVDVNTQPTITIDSPTEGARLEGIPEIGAAVTVTDPDGSSFTIEWWLDGNLENSSPYTTWPFVGLAPGPHSLMVKVIDQYGGEATDTVSFTVIEAPVVAITSPAYASAFVLGQSIQFTGTATDFEDGDLAAQIAWTSNVDGPIGTGGSFSSSTLSRNTHTITATVEDADGLVRTATVTIDVQTAPTVTINYPGEGESFLAGSNVSFGGVANDFEDGDISYEIVWTSSLDGAIGTGSAFSVSTLSAGQHLITATITDNMGASATDTVTILINTPPTVTITAPVTGTTVNQGAAVSFTGTATDAQDGNLTASISWSSNLDGALGSGAAVNTSSLSVGTHVITASVTDSHGAPDTDTITITINAPPSVAITAPAAGASFVEATNVTFTGTASDPEDGNLGASISWSSNLDGALGTGASVNSGSLSVGTHVITASVTDANGSVASATRSITITANTVPTVTITAPASGTTVNQGAAVSFTGTATDAQDGNLTASISWSSSLDGALGTGAAVNTSSLSVGTHVITASVTDSHGAPDTDTITITINAPPSVAITAPEAGASFVEATNVTFTGTASDPEDGTLAASISWSSNLDGALGTGASVNSSSLSVGTHVITASVTDASGSVATATRSITITANTAPTVTITAPASGGTVNQGASVSFTGTATDAQDGNLTASISWSSNLSGALGTGASVNTSSLSVGTHVITASVTDSHGAPDTDTITITINAPPSVAITAPAAGASFVEATNVTFTGTASDPEDGNLAASISWSSSLDGALGTGASVNSGTLSVGTHVITASVTDANGSVATATRSITITANTAPTVTITAPATGGTVNQGAAVSFTGTATDAQDGNLTASISWSSNLGGALGTGAAVNTSSLSVGTHVITASVTDSHGAPDTDTITITINAPPSVAITAPAAGASFVEATNVTFTGTASDPEDGNLAASIVWSSNLDGALGTGASVNSSSLSVGTHVITASVTDANGSTASATRSITITANTAPTVTITAPATGGTVNQGAALSFTGTATDAQDGNLTASISWSSSLDGALGTGASVNTSSLSVGTHVITASVTDSHGAPDTDTITITINAPPSVAITAPAAGASFVEATNVTFTGTASDPEDGNLAASISWSSSLDGALGTGASVNSGSLSVGTHVITASVTDANGSVATVTRSITITANTAPTVTITAPATGTTVNQGAALSFTGTATDAQDGNLTASITWSSNLDGALGTGAAVDTSSLSVGTHVITASVTDSHGAPDTDTITITINAPPSVAITAPAAGASFVEATNVTFTGTASDPEDGNLAASIVWSSNLDGALGTGASVNSSSLSVGTHVITASVTDASGSVATATRSITITANTAPTVTITAPASGGTVNQGAAVSFTGTATDAQDGNLTASISWSSNLDGALGTGAAVNTSSLSVGTHVITASVTDSHGAPDTDTITITINAPPSVAITAPAAGASFVEATNVTFAGTASDPEDGNLAASISWSSSLDGALGTGASVNSGTLSVGTHVITASVTDANGSVASATRSITITANTAPTVTITAPASGGTVNQGATVGFTGTAIDAQDGNLTASISWSSNLGGALGTGASVNTSSLSVGTHVITASVTDSHGAPDTDTITITINAPPTVAITAPAGGSSYIQGTLVSFLGSATDPEDGNLNPAMTWTSSLDGAIGSGGAPSTSALSVGTHLITASVVDSNGAPANASVSITILANTAPAVTITAPTNGVWVAVGDNVTFTGSALDAQSGDLSAGLVWTSNLNGTIGNGASFSTTALAVGSHTITAAVTDPQGLVGSAVITVEVKVVSTATFISVGTQDGFVLESGETTNVGGTVSTASPRLGDNNADRQYRSFLSFDTSSLPDNAVIRNVTVRAQRSGITGTNPATTHGTLQVDVKTGFFGTTVSLEAADFQSTATVDNACSMTPAAANGQWSEGTLNAAGRSAVSLTSSTQLRLRFSLDDDDDGRNDFLDHYGGESTVATTRPQLVIQYLQ